MSTVDCFNEKIPQDLPGLARRISDRHFGVGGDGLILIHRSDVADARMQMFNADGSEAEMCGNGIRCVAKYVYDHGLAKNRNLRIQTRAGILALDLKIVDGLAEQITVDMGEPILEPHLVPTTLAGVDTAGSGSTKAVIDVPLAVDDRELSVTCVSMGNPHSITYVEQLSDDWVLGLGPKIECDPHFPNRVNAEFVEVVSPGEIRMRVWERGSGETLACGTGACAVCVAGVLSGRSGREILAHLPGGDLRLVWCVDTNHVFMTGPAVEVFSGDWPE